MDPILEKFTRCPKCRSFSIRRADSQGKGPLYICDNCRHKFSMGNTTPQQPEKTLDTVEKKTPTKRVFLIFTIVVVGIFLIFYVTQRKNSQEKNPQSNMQIEKQATHEESMGNNNKPEEKDRDVLEVEQTKEDQSELLIQQVAKKGKLKPDQETNYGVEGNFTSKMVFGLSYIKVRKSHPDGNSESYRWAYSKESINLKRNKDQRVFIAGNASGNGKWLVDDQIIINGEKINGFSREVAEIGTIPQINKLPPLDITHLVPANRDMILKIQLVDYGKFWGNTAIYLVVK